MALSGDGWPAWTLLHSLRFEIDLDLFDRRLWSEVDHLEIAVYLYDLGEVYL